MTLYLQEDGTLYLQDSFTLDNVLDVLPWSTYNLNAEWTPAIQNWPNGGATLAVNLIDTNDDLVGYIFDAIDIGVN